MRSQDRRTILHKNCVNSLIFLGHSVILIFTWCDDGAGGRGCPRSVCVDTWHWAVSRVLVMTCHVSGSLVTCHVAIVSQPRHWVTTPSIELRTSQPEMESC